MVGLSCQYKIWNIWGIKSNCRIIFTKERQNWLRACCVQDIRRKGGRIILGHLFGKGLTVGQSGIKGRCFWSVSHSFTDLDHPYIKERVNTFFLSSCWSTRDHIGRSTRSSNPDMTSSTGGAKGCSDHRFRAPPAFTAQLLTLHQHRANNQYRTANQI